MINLSRIITSPNFAQPNGYTVYRNYGTWVDGRFTTTEDEFNAVGTILPADAKTIKQIPEGDSISGSISIWSLIELYTTKLESTADNDGYISDEVVWNGNRYKIVSSNDYSNFGYYKSVAVRKKGA